VCVQIILDFIIDTVQKANIIHVNNVDVTYFCPWQGLEERGKALISSSSSHLMGNQGNK
jgi:hypothetical protein